MNSPGGPKVMKVLLVVTGFIETGAGLALMAFPAWTVGLFLGPALEASSPMAVVRTFGALLLALGIGCWLASRDTQKPCARRMVMVMTLYNPTTALALAASGLKAVPPGILLWPAVALHAGMAVWCIVRLVRGGPPVVEKAN
jgi:multisubunit Na+/H+ antiporter MnhG subunit